MLTQLSDRKSVPQEVKLPSGTYLQIDKNDFQANIIYLEIQPVPSQKWSYRPNSSKQINANYFQKRTLDRHWPSSHSLYNHIVTVVGDHCHRPNRSASEQRSTHGIDVAPHRTQDPGFVKTIDHHRWTHDDHHHEIGECKIENQQVGRRPKGLSGRKNVDDDSIAAPRNYAQDDHNRSQAVVPCG